MGKFCTLKDAIKAWNTRKGANNEHKILRKAINVVYLNYYGNNISNLCVERIINYYKQFTKLTEREKRNERKD